MLFSGGGGTARTFPFHHLHPESRGHWGRNCCHASWYLGFATLRSYGSSSLVNLFSSFPSPFPSTVAHQFLFNFNQDHGNGLSFLYLSLPSCSYSTTTALSGTFFHGASPFRTLKLAPFCWLASNTRPVPKLPFQLLSSFQHQPEHSIVLLKLPPASFCA